MKRKLNIELVASFISFAALDTLKLVAAQCDRQAATFGLSIMDGEAVPLDKKRQSLSINHRGIADWIESVDGAHDDQVELLASLRATVRSAMIERHQFDPDASGSDDVILDSEVSEQLDSEVSDDGLRETGNDGEQASGEQASQVDGETEGSDHSAQTTEQGAE